jgi:hypothetical protein
MASCTYAPKKGADLFYALKKELGYNKAWDVIGIINNPKFKQDFADTLTLDSEGIPTLASVMGNKYIQGFLGIDNTAKMLQREYSAVEDTMSNYKSALEQAKLFNTTSEHKNNFTAVVKNKDGKLRVTILPRTETALEEFKDQYAAHSLNRQLETILEPVGITVGMLSEAEIKAGRTGVINFAAANRMAQDTISMIRVANNRQGFEALSEEYSHLLVAAFKDTPLLERLINALAKDEEALRVILGDEYADTVNFQDGDMALVAEEAVGQLLREHFAQKVGSKSALINRFRDFVHSKYKGMDESDVAHAIVESESVLSSLVQKMLEGTLKVDPAKIETRMVQLNSLADRLDRNMELLKHMKVQEVKQAQLSGTRGTSDTLHKINVALNNSTDIAAQAVGFTEYSMEALKAFTKAQGLLNSIDRGISTQDTFRDLRQVEATIGKYGKFIKGLNDTINEEKTLRQEQFEVEIDDEGNPVYTPLDPEDVSMFAEPIPILQDDGTYEYINMYEVLSALNDISQRIASEFEAKSLSSFASFLEPVLGTEVTTEIGKNAGTGVLVTDLLKRASNDISFFDRWLDSMGQSRDPILNAFDEIVKRQNEEAKDKAQGLIRRLQKIMLDAKDKGITDFDWMFEKLSDGSLSGDYISEINRNQYHKERLEMEAALEAKYGRNPKGEELEAKKREREAWHLEHSKKSFGRWRINERKYENAAYKALSKDQREILDRLLAIKEIADKLLPAAKVDKLKAVQMRRMGNSRVLDSLAHPSRIWENIKEAVAEELLDRNDDNLTFGENNRRGLKDFSGKEYMELPALYTNRLENPNDLNRDVIGSLMAYVAMACKYEAMNEVVDALEVGRSIVNKREVQKTVGNQPMVEKLSNGFDTVTAKILQDGKTNMQAKLDDFMASQVYNRLLKDYGTFDVFGQKINKNKAVSLLLKYSSLAQLGFNALANLANVTQGVAMQNIEAAAGEFFNAKELAKADAAYGRMITGYLSELGSRVKTNKLWLFDQAIDFKGDYFKDMKHQDMRKFVQRVLGKELAFIGQEAGDHWLYNRTAIAMAMRTKVNVPGKGVMSLWDALEYESPSGINDSRIKECRLPQGTTFVKTGETASLKRFGREVLEINQELFGIYNEEDANAANRVIGGRLVMQYRKYMRPLWNKRFGESRKSLITGREYEGFYRSLFKFASAVAKEKSWKNNSFMLNATEHQKRNLRRAVMDILQWAVMAALANFLEWPDDDDNYIFQLTEYLVKRLNRELGMFALSPIMFQEWYNTITAPAATLSVVKQVGIFVGSLVNPVSWMDEIEQGRYKGMTQVGKAAYLLPIPYLSYYRQWDKFYNRLDEMSDYYTRSR